MIDTSSCKCLSTSFFSALSSLSCRAPYRYTDEGRFSYSSDGHTFDFFIDGGLTFLCVTDGDGLPWVNSFKFLKTMSIEFQTNYSDQASTANEGSLNSSYGEQLKAMIENAAREGWNYAS